MSLSVSLLRLEVVELYNSTEDTTTAFIREVTHYFQAVCNVQLPLFVSHDESLGFIH